MSTRDKHKQMDELSGADRNQILRLDIKKQELKEKVAIAQAKKESAMRIETKTLLEEVIMRWSLKWED